MFERYVLAYVFICFVIGVACLGLVLNLAKRRDARLARAFLGFYVALSTLVASALLLTLADAFPTAIGPATRSTLEYVESIIGFYGVMLMLPIFMHRVFGIVNQRRERGLLVLVAVAVAVQHVTEYALDDLWDQRGDLIENVLFLLVLAYVCGVAVTQRNAAGAARPLAGRMLAGMVVAIPILVYDLFLAETIGIRLYPVAYCIFSIMVTSTLTQSASPAQPELAEDPGWNLSEREKEVLQLLRRGLSNKDIGSQLFISTNTVKTHLRSIFEKTGARSRFQLIAMAQAGPEPLDSGGKDSPT